MDEVLIIDKPAGMSSHDVVNRVRRVAQERRVGHAGTLDPFATGVLVVCVGRSTRLSQYLVGLDKRYLATVRLGFGTDSQDLTGKQITALASSKHVTRDDIEAVMKQFTGQLSQLPPMYSAKKVDGRRLYEAARKGEQIDRKPVDIVVYSLSMVQLKGETSEGSPIIDNQDGTRDFVIEVHCSSGTYIRTLAHDIGERLGVGAHLGALRRTAVGHLGLDRAIRLDELEEAGRPGIERFGFGASEAMSHIRLLTVTAEEGRRVANGMELDVSSEQDRQVRGGGYRPGELVRLVNGYGRLLAVGEFYAARQAIRPKTVMAAAGSDAAGS
jgi:tRNA pseudouridine55 synthase